MTVSSVEPHISFALCRLQLSVETIAAVDNDSGQESIRWHAVRCLLASPPIPRFMKARFLVDGADSSRLFVDVPPDNGDHTGRITWQAENASSPRNVGLIHTRVW